MGKLGKTFAAAVVVGVGLLGLTGCSADTVPQEPEQRLLGYGPCSTPRECADQSKAEFETIVGIWGDDFASDCLAAHTEAIGKMMSRANQGEKNFDAEATSGNCRVKVTITNGTAMKVDFYGV